MMVLKKTKEESGEGLKLLAIIRIRGRVNVSVHHENAFKNLNLLKKNTLSLFSSTTENLGQIKKLSDFVTFGEIELETLVELLVKRGELIGGKKITKESAESFAKELFSCSKKLSDLGIKPHIHLNMPRGGFERGGIKKPYKVGGVLGYRGEKINELIRRMI